MYVKIGAKVTACFQPMDVGVFFKLKKKYARILTAVDEESSLKRAVEGEFARLRDDGFFTCSGNRLRSIIDLTCCIPEIQSRSLSKDKVQDAYVSAGFMDAVSKTCPDLYGMMGATSIDFDRFPWKKELFLDNVLKCIVEMLRYGNISEEFYESIGAYCDKDAEGNEYKPAGPSECYLRSKPLNSMKILEEKQKQMMTSLNKLRSRRTAKINQLRNIETRAIETRQKLTALANALPSKKIADIPLLEIQALKKPDLAAFIQCILLKDLYHDEMKLPSRGSADKVLSGERDRTTDGPFLIELVQMHGDKPFQASIPDLPPIEIPEPLVVPPVVRQVQASMNVSDFTANREFVEAALDCVTSIKLQPSHNNYLGNLKKLTELTHALATKIGDRLHAFLLRRVPENRPDCRMHMHWVWRSFMHHLPKIACLMVLSGHQAGHLLTAGSSESLLSNNVADFLIIAAGASAELKNCDGCYLAEDSLRRQLIRAGMTIKGLYKRWREHLLAAAQDWERMFYLRYPCQHSRYDASIAWGTFQQLNQRVGLAWNKVNMGPFVGLFDWKDSEKDMLMKLSGRRLPKDDLLHRQYTHLSYLVETAYAVSITPEHNITLAPTCEWQLGCYGTLGAS